MGNRFVLDRANKANASCFEMWSKAREGRFYKRKLSKARRRAWKERSDTHLTHWESVCNNKNW